MIITDSVWVLQALELNITDSVWVLQALELNITGSVWVLQALELNITGSVWVLQALELNMDDLDSLPLKLFISHDRNSFNKPLRHSLLTAGENTGSRRHIDFLLIFYPML